MAGVKHYQTNVAIVGGGGAGMAAGIEALDAGAHAVVFEKAAEPGGAAIISGGGCLIVGSPLQTAEWHSRYARPGVQGLDRLGRTLGRRGVGSLLHRTQPARSLLLGRKPRRQMVRPEIPGGQFGAAVDPDRAQRSRPDDELIDGFHRKGGEIVADTEITALKRENGRISGFEGRNARTGEPVSVRSKAVVVTTGGFNSNLDMVLEFSPTLGNDKILEGSGRNSTGSGHKLIRQAGGYLTHMDHIWFYVYATPDYRDPAQRRGLVFRLVPGNIWVNQQGRRFHNEAVSGGNSATPALMAQSRATPGRSWIRR